MTTTTFGAASLKDATSVGKITAPAFYGPEVGERRAVVINLWDGPWRSTDRDDGDASWISDAVVQRLRANGHGVSVLAPVTTATSSGGLLEELRSGLTLPVGLDGWASIFINAVGCFTLTSLVEADTGAVANAFAGQLTAVCLAVREALVAVADGGAVCVCVRSRPDAARPAHSLQDAVAAAVGALVATVALEVAARSVCVTVLGAVEPAPDQDTTGELASVAEFLLGPESSFCSGGVVSMDGARATPGLGRVLG